MGLFSAEDIATLEEGTDDPRAAYVALQRAINSGMWGLQGSYGRAMMAAIEAGQCMLGEQPARDYWGNRIPSRTEVQDGTKGSASFVLDTCGPDWLAAMMEA